MPEADQAEPASQQTGGQQAGFGHAEYRDRDDLTRAQQSRIEGDRQDGGVVAGEIRGQRVQHGMPGDLLLGLGRYDAHAEPRGNAGNRSARRGAARCLGHHAVGHRLRRVAVDQQQFHRPLPTQRVNPTSVAAAR